MTPTPTIETNPLTMWHGMALSRWLRLLWLRPPIDHSEMRRVLELTTASLGNSVLNLVEWLCWQRRIQRVQLHPEPVFILGHWRSGTTLLQNLMALDRRLAFVNCFQAAFPGHFLVSQSWLPRCLTHRLPAQRPMDDMPLAWDLPQEDEAALAVMTLLSPYIRAAFVDPPASIRRLENLRSGLSHRESKTWSTALLRLLRKVALQHGSNRFVLKSPPHTGRIPLLLELFPRALFVHLVRNPYEVYGSTLRLRQSMHERNSLSRQLVPSLEQEVIETYQSMYQAYQMQKALIAPERLLEMKYEDLIADPLETIQGLYERFELPGFDEVVPRIKEFLVEHRRYQTRTGPLSPEQRDHVTQQWGMALRRYGYAVESTGVREAAPTVNHSLNPSNAHDDRVR